MGIKLLWKPWDKWHGPPIINFVLSNGSLTNGYTLVQVVSTMYTRNSSGLVSLSGISVHMLLSNPLELYIFLSNCNMNNMWACDSPCCWNSMTCRSATMISRMLFFVIRELEKLHVKYMCQDTSYVSGWSLVQWPSNRFSVISIHFGLHVSVMNMFEEDGNCLGLTMLLSAQRVSSSSILAMQW